MGAVAGTVLPAIWISVQIAHVSSMSPVGLPGAAGPSRPAAWLKDGHCAARMPWVCPNVNENWTVRASSANHVPSLSFDRNQPIKACARVEGLSLALWRYLHAVRAVVSTARRGIRFGKLVVMDTALFQAPPERQFRGVFMGLAALP